MMLATRPLVWLLVPILHAPALSLVVAEVCKARVVRDLLHRFVASVHTDRCQALGEASASQKAEPFVLVMGDWYAVVEAFQNHNG